MNEDLNEKYWGRCAARMTKTRLRGRQRLWLAVAGRGVVKNAGR